MERFLDKFDPTDKEDTLLILMTIGELLTKHSIPWFINFGTLLGHVRHEQKTIPWDDDIDIVILGGMDEHMDKLNEVLKRDDLRIIKYSNFYKVVPLVGKYPFVDIFATVQHHRTNRWHVIYEDPPYKRHKYEDSDILPLQESTFEGIDCFLPAKPIEVLNADYPDWHNVGCSRGWDHKASKPEPVITKYLTEIIIYRRKHYG